MSAPRITFVNCDDTPDRCDVDFFDLSREVQDRLGALQLDANGTKDKSEHKRLRGQYETQLRDELNKLRRSIGRHVDTDTALPGDTAMDPQLIKIANLHNVRTDSRSEREIALAILAAVGTRGDSPRNDSDPTRVDQMSTLYLTVRAIAEATPRADARNDAAPRVARTDGGCGCGAPRADGLAVEREARAARDRRNRLAHVTQSDAATERAAEAEEREAARLHARPIAGAAPRVHAVTHDAEAKAKALRDLESRLAHKSQSEGEN